MIRLFFILFFISFSVMAKEQAITCAACVKAQQLTEQVSKGASKSVERANDFLSRFQASAKSDVRAKELEAVIALAVKVIPKDEMGSSIEYIAGIYEDNKKDFETAMKRLGPQSRKIIQDAIKHGSDLMDNGNG